MNRGWRFLIIMVLWAVVQTGAQAANDPGEGGSPASEPRFIIEETPPVILDENASNIRELAWASDPSKLPLITPGDLPPSPPEVGSEVVDIALASQTVEPRKPRIPNRPKAFWAVLEPVLMLTAHFGNQAGETREEKLATLDGMMLVKEIPVDNHRTIRRWFIKPEKGKPVPLVLNFNLLVAVKTPGILDSPVSAQGKWAKQASGTSLGFFAVERLQIAGIFSGALASQSLLASGPGFLQLASGAGVLAATGSGTILFGDFTGPDEPSGSFSEPPDGGPPKEQPSSGTLPGLTLPVGVSGPPTPLPLDQK